MAYGVVRTDLMFGTDNRVGLVSFMHMGANGSTATAVENGNVVKIGALKANEREIYVASDVAANTALKDVVLVATPELMADEHKHNLDEFINEAGKPARGYTFHSGNVFSVTKDCLAGEASPAKGDIVELAAGTKLNVAKASTGATSGSTVVGKILDIEVVGRYTYYVIKVD